MLGCLRRRGARKTPKRLRALRFRTVGPWLYLGSGRSNASLLRRPGDVKQAHKTAGAIEANPLRSYLHGALPTARRPGESRTGVRDWQTQGDSTLREKLGVFRRARRRSRGCARTLMSHLQKSTSGLGSEKPFPQYVVLRKKDGGRGGREPGLRMYSIVPSRVRCHRRPGLSERSSSLRSYAWRGEP